MEIVKRRSSLVSRFAASTAVLAAVVVVLAIVFFVAVQGDFLKGAIRTTLRGFSLSLAERIWQEDDRDFTRLVARTHGIGIAVVTPEESYAFGPGGEAVEPEELLREDPRYLRVDATGARGVRLTFSWDLLVFARAHVPLLAGLIVLLVAVIGVTYAFQVALLRPLRQLRAGVEAVSMGDFKTEVPVVRQDEIGGVADAFNRMTRRIARMMADRELLLADVSHELRSPLARIKVALELLPEGDKREAIRRDVREMESLTSVLLERERLQARTERLEREIVDLTALTREVVRTFEDGPPGVVLTEAEERLEVVADAALVRVLVQNLVDNAVKFSLPASGPVEVSLRSSARSVELVVEDDGPGIPAAEAERVFEPFVKLDPARGHRRGYGLGLNLCRRIVEAHGGSIEMSGGVTRGARARVILPLSRDRLRA